MYVKSGLPEVGDFTICTIKDVQATAAKVALDEYKDLEGMVHTSEMDRRWVRYLKVYLKVGRKLVCKVLDVDPKNRHINLSTKRVGASQSRTKMLEWKNEKKADDLLQAFAKLNKIENIYGKIGNKILDKYGVIFPVLQEIVKDNSLLDKLDLEKNLAKKFYEFLQTRIAVQKARFSGTLKLSSEKPNGVELIKKACSKLQELAKKENAKLEIKYLGAPKYKLDLEIDDAKAGERLLESFIRLLEKELEVVEFKKA